MANFLNDRSSLPFTLNHKSQMTISSSVRTALNTIEPFSILLIVGGSVGLYEFGTANILTAPSTAQIVASGCLLAGGASYMVAHGLLAF
jgi:hypothetical protein